MVLAVVLMVLVVLVMGLVGFVVVGTGAGLTFPGPALTLTFCLLLGGDVSSIWLGLITSVGCIFPISCKSPLSFTHFPPFNLLTHLWSVSQKVFLELCKAGLVPDGSSKVIVSEE